MEIQETFRKFDSYLIASNNMNNNKEVSHYNKPCWFFQGKEDVIFNFIAKHPISNECNREVAQCNDYIGNNNSSPHRPLGWLLGCRWDCCLDLQDNIVPGICKSHITQGTKEVKDCPCCSLSFVSIRHIWLNTLAD